MATRTRKPPSGIADALKRPALLPTEVAHVTGLSYGTVIADIRAGELKALCHRTRPGARPCYSILRPHFVCYLKRLGCPIPPHSS